MAKRNGVPVVLRGLDGTNPMGALAALGVQAAFLGDDEPPSLWWTNDHTPCAVVDAGIGEIAERAMLQFAESALGAAIAPSGTAGAAKGASALKFPTPADTKEYLRDARNAGEWDAALASALVCEGPQSGKGDSKQTDFYFSSGQQKFLDIAKKVLESVSESDVAAALESPWAYADKAESRSFGWDSAHDAEFTAVGEEMDKFTNIGAEALALLGLTFHPVFGISGRRKTATAGCGDSRGIGRYFDWPLWDCPASPDAVRVLSNMDYGKKSSAGRLGVFRVMRSRIRRNPHGYGMLSPSIVLWENSERLRGESA